MLFKKLLSLIECNFRQAKEKCSIKLKEENCVLIEDNSFGNTRKNTL